MQTYVSAELRALGFVNSRTTQLAVHAAYCMVECCIAWCGVVGALDLRGTSVDSTYMGDKS